jgi:polyphosphate kinase
MPRNFFRRVEAVFPIEDAELRRRVTQDILPIELRDNEDARELQPDGSYTPPGRAAGEESFRAQKYFMAAAGLRAAAPTPAPAVAAPPASPGA